MAIHVETINLLFYYLLRFDTLANFVHQGEIEWG